MNDALKNLLPDNVADTALMQRALTHRSADPQANNERLEFLGDTALGLAVSQWLFERRAHWSEGDMSRLRSTLVNRDALYTIGRNVDLPDQILLSDSFCDPNRAISPRVIAGTVEAVIGAVYLQCDWTTTRQFILDWLSPLLAEVPDDPESAKDNKTALQEWLQARGRSTPNYRVMVDPAKSNSEGFVVLCRGGGLHAIGKGSSKKKAELNAAGDLLAKLSQSAR